MDEEVLLDVEQGFKADTDVSEPSASDTSLSVPLIEYTAENPLPVVLVEEEEAFTDVYSLEDGVNGTISATYLDYFEGIVEKLGFNQHYVVWKSGDYSYTMLYGKNMDLVGDLVSSYDVEQVRLYRSGTNQTNWLVEHRHQENIELRTGSLFVYSDLGMFPTLERGLSRYESLALLFFAGFALVYAVCSCIFKCLDKR